MTLHFALCLQVSDKPRYHLNRICNRYKKECDDPYVQSIVRSLLRKLPTLVEQVEFYVELHVEAGRFTPEIT